MYHAMSFLNSAAGSLLSQFPIAETHPAVPNLDIIPIYPYSPVYSHPRLFDTQAQTTSSSYQHFDYNVPQMDTNYQYSEPESQESYYSNALSLADFSLI